MRGRDRESREARRRALPDPAPRHAPLPDPRSEEIGDLRLAEALRARLLERLRALASRDPDPDAETLAAGPLQGLDLRRFAGELCRVLGLPAAERQGLLEAGNIAERLERLDGFLAFHEAAAGSPQGSETPR
jgi:Lon protease-like protein